jgi:DNA invertase Pin-like site-specific DNA recombinase
VLPNDPIQSGAPGPVRCAIYTRKSTEEGLSQEFNSLDAQRECAEAYIQSQRNQGWVALPNRYDDGGFTGANLDRPALRRLLADIEAHRVDCVVLYKVDRLSRSLFDFTRLMRIFDEHEVSFVSVTQQFNSSTPMGRLTLNILLSFAEFERHLISERTRDKISAARRKGKWMGGYPVLGYDPDPSRRRLAVNEAEAEQVREIFALFVRHRSLIPALEEIQSRGWRLKSWTTGNGEHHTGQPFDRHSLARLLSNVLYLGQVSYQGKVYPGEQSAIVEAKVWKKANELLQKQARGEDGRKRNRQGALLKDLLRCAGCGKPMVVGYTTKGGRRYPYYVCLTAQKRGVRACPGRLVAAGRIEKAVVEALYHLAGQPHGAALRDALPVDEGCWEELERNEQHRVLATLVERITYDRRLEQGRIRLCQELGLPASQEVVVGAGKQPLVRQTPPTRLDQAVPVQPVPERLPRITKLLALAVRFEELLRNGTAKDYADLARLGGVSRSRITQVMHLRNLAPALQERILLLSMGPQVGNTINERALRRISTLVDWREQITQFEQYLADRNGAAR